MHWPVNPICSSSLFSMIKQWKYFFMVCECEVKLVFIDIYQYKSNPAQPHYYLYSTDIMYLRT